MTKHTIKSNFLQHVMSAMNRKTPLELRSRTIAGRANVSGSSTPYRSVESTHSSLSARGAAVRAKSPGRNFAPAPLLRFDARDNESDDDDDDNDDENDAAEMLQDGSVSSKEEEIAPVAKSRAAAPAANAGVTIIVAALSSAGRWGRDGLTSLSNSIRNFDRPLWTRGNDHRLRRASWVPFCLQITLLVLLVVLLIWFFLWPFVGLWWTTTTTTAPAISPAVVQPPITGDATAKLAQLEQRYSLLEKELNALKASHHTHMHTENGAQVYDKATIQSWIPPPPAPTPPVLSRKDVDEIVKAQLPSVDSFIQTAKPTLQKMVDASQPKLPEVPSEATIKEWARAVAATLVDALPRSLSESDVKTLASNVFKDNKHSLVPVVTSSGAPSEDTIKHWIADAISAQATTLRNSLNLIDAERSKADAERARLVAEAHSKSPQKPSIDEQAVRRIIEEYERNRPQSASSPSPPPTSTVDEKTVRRIVEDYVDRDRVAMVDYALNQAGATILSDRTSKPYFTPITQRSWTDLLAMRSEVAMPPEVALSPDNTPGNCYAFAGDHGSIGVRLIAPVRPTHVTVDHLSRAIAFSVASAPKSFRVHGYTDVDAVTTPIDLGTFEYTLAETSHKFALKPTTQKVAAVVFEFLSNHGGKFTCVYRVRVHGNVEEKK